MEFSSTFFTGLASGVVVTLIAWFIYLKVHRSEESRASKNAHLMAHREFHSNIDLVIQDLAQLCKDHPSLAQPYLTLGNLYRIQGETQRSIVIHQNLMTDESLSKTMRDRVRIEMACDLIELGWEEKAFQPLQEVPDRSPLYFLAQEKLIELHYKRQEFEAAFLCILNMLHKRKSWRNSKRAAYFLALQANKYLQDGDVPSAKKFVSRAFGFDSDCILALLVEGQTHLEDHEFDAAIEKFTRIMHINAEFAFLAIPKIEDAFYGKQSFMRLGDSLQSLGSTFQNNPVLVYSLGKFFRKKKMFNEARRYLRQSLEMNPTYVLAHEEMLNLNTEENKHAEVVQDYQDFLDELKRNKRYVCTYCASKYQEMTWHCSACGRWESIQADLFLAPGVSQEQAAIEQHQASHS